MSISSAMTNAQSGLSAATRRADIVSNNIANALTPGYARRELSVAEQILNGRGGGVEVVGVSRSIDPALTRERRNAEGAAARDSAIASTLQSLNAALGDHDDAYSLFGRYEALETALRDLAETPESSSYQNQALDAAKALVRGFNDLAAGAQQARQDADAKIGESVDFVNATLKQIEDLNEDIARAGAGRGDATALEDQRSTLIDEIASIIPVREIPRGNGEVDLMTNEGVFLIAGEAREIAFTTTAVITPDLAYNDGVGVLSGLSVDGVDITPGGPSSQGAQQGSLAGLFAVRDAIIPEYTTQLDALARDLVERFEAVDPTLASGAAGLFTDAGAAFDPAAELGLASRLTLNTAVDPDSGGEIWRLRDGLGAASEGPPGNDDILRLLLDRMTEERAAPVGLGVTGEKTASEAASELSSAIGSKRLAAESALSASQARADAVIESELAVTGVDSDAELQKLILIEQAYAANARVLQTAQAMIQTLMEI